MQKIQNNLLKDKSTMSESLWKEEDEQNLINY